MALRRHNMLGTLVQSAPKVIQSKTDASNSSGSWVYSFTSVPTDGDLIVIISATGQAKTQTISGSFNTLTSNNQLYIFWKIASSEPSSYTITIAGSFNASALGLTFRNFRSGDPISLVNGGVTNLAASTTFTVPASPSTVNKNTYTIGADSHAIATLSTLSNGFVSLSTQQRLHTCKKEYAIYSGLQDVTFTYTGATDHNGVLFSINPKTV